MSKSATKSLANTETVRDLVYKVVSRFRAMGKKTPAAIDDFAISSGVNRHQLHRYFFNQALGSTKDDDLDRVSLGFINAMMSAAAFFKEQAMKCEMEAEAEMVARQLRQQIRGRSNCSPITSVRPKSAA